MNTFSSKTNWAFMISAQPNKYKTEMGKSFTLKCHQLIGKTHKWYKTKLLIHRHRSNPPPPPKSDSFLYYTQGEKLGITRMSGSVDNSHALFFVVSGNNGFGKLYGKCRTNY